MRQKTLAVTLMFGVLAIASIVILLVAFQMKSKRGESSAASVPPAQNGIVASAPSANFPHVDGVISRGEYPHLYRDPQNGMTLSWKIDESRELIYFGLTCPVPGRVAISLEPTGPRMKGGDILIAYVKDGQVYAQDAYADQLTSHSPDRDLGGTDDILEKAGSSGPQGTTVELVRRLVTADGYDKPIARDQTMRVQLACSEFTNFTGLFGDTWTTIGIQFYTGELRQVPPP
jgi:hypothetical protein